MLVKANTSISYMLKSIASNGLAKVNIRKKNSKANTKNKYQDYIIIKNQKYKMIITILLKLLTTNSEQKQIILAFFIFINTTTCPTQA